jgi:hypothetical protein
MRNILGADLKGLSDTVQAPRKVGPHNGFNVRPGSEFLQLSPGWVWGPFLRPSYVPAFVFGGKPLVALDCHATYTLAMLIVTNGCG